MGELESLLVQVDAAIDEIVRFHQDIVRIPTVNTGQMPTGNETACCEYIRDRLGAEGIGAKILESAPGRGNLIARLKGDGSGPSLLLMSHLDVVPVEDPARWRHPPFEAVLAEGRIWGRGSDDAKAVATAGYFATVLLKRSGLKLKGDLIYTATADEESGGFYGYGWLARNVPDEVRADYALNEGGGYPVKGRRGLAAATGRELAPTPSLPAGGEGVRLIPVLTAGFMDSQWVRPLGVAAYGFAPIHPESETFRPGVHGVDENFPVRDLVVRTKAYLAAAYFTLVEGL